jgi:hypothetical protein
MTTDFDRNIMKAVRLLNSDLERGCGVVDHALKLLDRSAIPSIPFNLDHPNVQIAVERAFSGLVLLWRIFRCFKLEPSKMRALEDLCFPRVVERWGDVTDWMVAMITGAGQSRNAHELLGLCAEAMECIIHQDAGDNVNPAKRELVSLPVTVHVICTLLAQTPKSHKGYFYIVGGSNECAAIELFWTFVSTETGRRTFITALNSYDHKMKRRVVDSLTLRPQQFVKKPPPGNQVDPSLEASIARTLCHLIQGLARIFQDDEILRCFVRRDFIGRCAYALDTLAERATSAAYHTPEFWELLSEATVCYLQDIVLKRTKKPYREFAQALTDGVLLCAERCVINVESKVVRERLLCGVFAEVCNYCMFKDVCMARASRYEPDVTTKLSESCPPGFSPMLERLAACLMDCGASLKAGTERLVNLCCNLNVRVYRLALVFSGINRDYYHSTLRSLWTPTVKRSRSSSAVVASWSSTALRSVR